MKRIQVIFVICAFLFGSASFTSLFAQNGNRIFTISGLVKDKKTNKTIEYVNVNVKGTNEGTITNSDGSFTLKVKQNNRSRTLEVSSLGYSSAQYTIEEKDESNKTFYLEPNSVILKEVQVVKVDARAVVAEALKGIATNYNNQPSLSTGFYRETVQKGKRFIQISEAVAKVSKSPYKDNSVSNDRVKILKGRKLLSPKTSDTLAVKLVGGPTGQVFLDIVKNPDVILNSDFLNFYSCKFKDYVNIDGRLHYVISFAPVVETEEPLYEGLLYIDKENFTISRAEMDVDMSNKNKVTDLILRKKPAGLRFTPTKVSYLINYKRTGLFSSLSYIRSEIKFKCDWKRKLFATNYTVISEFAVTDRQDNSDEKIVWKESFRPEDVLSDKMEYFYDEKFWGDYNIIEPTESLDKAVLKLKKEHKYIED